MSSIVSGVLIIGLQGSIQEKFGENYFKMSNELILGVDISIALIAVKIKSVNKFLLMKVKKS